MSGIGWGDGAGQGSGVGGRAGKTSWGRIRNQSACSFFRPKRSLWDLIMSCLILGQLFPNLPVRWLVPPFKTSIISSLGPGNLPALPVGIRVMLIQTPSLLGEGCRPVLWTCLHFSVLSFLLAENSP